MSLYWICALNFFQAQTKFKDQIYIYIYIYDKLWTLFQRLRRLRVQSPALDHRVHGLSMVQMYCHILSKRICPPSHLTHKFCFRLWNLFPALLTLLLSATGCFMVILFSGNSLAISLTHPSPPSYWRWKQIFTSQRETFMNAALEGLFSGFSQSQRIGALYVKSLIM